MPRKPPAHLFADGRRKLSGHFLRCRASAGQHHQRSEEEVQAVRPRACSGASALWERWTAALAKIRDEGIVVAYDRLNNNGEVIQTEKVNLHLAVAKDCEKQMAAILAKLGLTPKDRDSVRPTAPSTKELPVVPGSLDDLMTRFEKYGVAQEELT
jgi:Phage terminase, small subunit